MPDQIFKDVKILAEIDPSEKFTFYPSDGEHIFSAQPKGMCGEGMVETAVVVIKDGELSIVSDTGQT